MAAFEVPAVDCPDPQRLRWPGGERLAVWVVPNVEVFEIDQPVPGVSNDVPNVPAYALREYGNRVGFWRIADLLDEYGVPATVALNGHVCDAYPAIVERIVSSGWEIMGHNLTNSQRLPGLGRDGERLVIHATLDEIERASGSRPRGWLGAGLQESEWTLGLLAEAGVEYVSDWVNDDQPCILRQGQTELVSVPCTMEINDKGIFERHGHPAAEYVERARRQFDVLYREGAEGATRSMAIAVHPYLTGQPHRIDALREVLDYVTGHDGVWLTTGGAIAEVCRAAYRR